MALLDQEGFVVLDGAVPISELSACRAAAHENLDRCLERARALGQASIPVGTSCGYAEIVHRAPGRFDMLHGTESAAFAPPPLGEEAAWMSVIRAVLGAESRLLYRGVLMTRPRAREQSWHADGEHLFPAFGLHLPAHCVNVFVPLVDVGADNGPTEFCPGSHRLTRRLADPHEQDDDLLERIGFSGPTVTPELPAGSVLLFDYRLVHRGQANRTDADRPILYLTFAAPWFQDVRSFPERRLFA